MLSGKNTEVEIILNTPDDLGNYVKMWLAICDYASHFQNMRSLMTAGDKDEPAQDKKQYIKDFSELALQIANIDNMIYERIKTYVPNLMIEWEKDNKNIYEGLFDPSNANFKNVAGLQTIAITYLKKEYGEKGIDELVARKAALFDDFSTLNHGNPISKFTLKDILDEKEGIKHELEAIRGTFVRIFIERKRLFFLQINIRLTELANKVAPESISKNDFINFPVFIDRLEPYMDYRSLTVKDEIATKSSPSFVQITLPDDNNKSEYDNKTKELSLKAEGLDNALSEGDSQKVINCIKELEQKLTETTNVSFKYTLLKELKKDSLWNEGKRQEALAKHSTELGKTTFSYVGSRIGSYLIDGKPIDSDEFWVGFTETLGPVLFGAIGDLIGGPLLGSLLSGIGTSIFGAIFGQKPDPMELLGGKIDELQNNMNQRFDEVLHLLTDGFNEVFKDFNVLNQELELIEGQLRDIQKSVNDLAIVLEESAFKDDIQKLLASIQAISNIYDSIFIHNEIISDSFLTSLKDNNEILVLNQIEKAIKGYVSSDYKIVNASHVPENNGSLNGVFTTVISNLQVSNVSFQDGIDIIEKNLTIISSCLRYYFVNRGSIKAVWSGCLLFEPEKLGTTSSISPSSSVLIELYNMQNRNDRVNASLLQDADLIRNTVIGQNNLKLYQSYQSFKALAHDYLTDDNVYPYEGNFLTGFTFSGKTFTAIDVYNQKSKYYALNLNDGIIEVGTPYQFRFVDNPTDDKAAKQKDSYLSLSTYFYNDLPPTDQPSNTWADVQILLGSNNSLILRTLDVASQKEVRVFSFDDVIYDDQNTKRFIFEQYDTHGDPTLGIGAVIGRIATKVPFCSVNKMLSEKDPDTFSFYSKAEELEAELMRKMVRYYPTKGIRWMYEGNSSEQFLSLVIYTWDYQSEDYTNRKEVNTVFKIKLKDYLTPGGSYDLSALRDCNLFISVSERDKNALEFSLRKSQNGDVIMHTDLSMDLFYPIYYRSQLNYLSQLKYQGSIQAGEFLLDRNMQLVLEKDGRLLLYRLIDSLPRTKTLVTEIFTPKDTLINPVLKFEQHPYKDKEVRVLLSSKGHDVVASTMYRQIEENRVPRLYIQGDIVYVAIDSHQPVTLKGELTGQ